MLLLCTAVEESVWGRDAVWSKQKWIIQMMVPMNNMAVSDWFVKMLSNRALPACPESYCQNKWATCHSVYLLQLKPNHLYCRASGHELKLHDLHLCFTFFAFEWLNKNTAHFRYSLRLTALCKLRWWEQVAECEVCLRWHCCDITKWHKSY